MLTYYSLLSTPVHGVSVHYRFVLLLILPLLFSFTLSPMSQTIQLDKKQNSAQFFVENSSDEPIPVLFTITERIQKMDGKEEMPNTNELSVFPPQLIIPPKEKRAVRVLWKGRIEQQEKSFRLIAEQLPLDVKKEKSKGSGIKMLLKYVAALYVNPGKTKAVLNIKNINSTKANLMITIENNGTMHAPLLNPVLSFTKDKKTIELKSEDLKGLVGENILAKSTRVFKLAPNLSITNDSIGSIDIE